MKTQTTTQFLEYGPILKQMGIDFRAKEIWLLSGKTDFDNKWLLIITVKEWQMASLLRKILPVVREANIPFKTVKNEEHHTLLNMGVYGEHLLGHNIILYTSSVDEANKMAQTLIPLMKDYFGPKPLYFLRIGENIYTGLTKMSNGARVEGEENNKRMEIITPPVKQLPFHIDKKFLINRKSVKLIKWKFLIHSTILSLPKNEIIKCMNVRNFQWCLLKYGKAHMSADSEGRDICNRYSWEKEVLIALNGKVKAPRFIDMFDMGEDPCLVMSYIEGETLEKKVLDYHENSSWKKMALSTQIDLLKYYSDVLSIIESIHNAGYVHRDIKDSNFIINEKREMFVIDFELAYSMIQKKPLPAFLLGTPGYVSPEQMTKQIPTVKEDIYSLGALLAFILSGKPPVDFITSIPALKTKLYEITGNQEIVKLVTRCMGQQPSSRPTIAEIRESLDQYIQEIKQA